jgi:hypothetical protein
MWLVKTYVWGLTMKYHQVARRSSRNTARVWWCTWSDVDGSGVDGNKGVEGVLVEGVDLPKAVQQEEKHGATRGDRAILWNTNYVS